MNHVGLWEIIMAIFFTFDTSAVPVRGVLRPALSEGVPVQSAVPDGSASEGAACGDINEAVIK